MSEDVVTYMCDQRNYTLIGDAIVLTEFGERVLDCITRDGYVITAKAMVRLPDGVGVLELGAMPWCQHPSAVGYWLRGLLPPYTRVSVELQGVLDSLETRNGKGR